MKKSLLYKVSVALFLGLEISSVSFAGNTVPLNYNIIPENLNGSIIDTKAQNQINFSLFEKEDALYCNGIALDISNNSFSINTEGLAGKKEFAITNSLNEVSNYTYYFSDVNGFVQDYMLDELSELNLDIYVTTVRNVKVVYTNLEKDSIEDIKNIILSLPEKMLVNTKEIKLIPANHSSGAAGITNYNKITFYNISKYSKATIKNIVIHEIAHTWAYELIRVQAIDYSYTEYAKAVNSDKRFPSNYAKRNVEAGNYSEDFAESVSFYFINENSFENKYPARTEYIKGLINTYLAE